MTLWTGCVVIAVCGAEAPPAGSKGGRLKENPVNSNALQKPHVRPVNMSQMLKFKGSWERNGASRLAPRGMPKIRLKRNHLWSILKQRSGELKGPKTRSKLKGFYMSFFEYLLRKHCLKPYKVVTFGYWSTIFKNLYDTHIVNPNDIKCCCSLQ